MKKKRLPIAKAVFSKIIEGGFCYVDKTHFIKQLDESGETYWFLSRPRRFGKSLFVDTLRAAYSGEKQLFKGLYLENNWNWDKKYPVININLTGGTRRTIEQLHNGLNFNLKTNADNFGIELNENEIPDRFAELIEKVYDQEKRSVVVLIDEYDKPLLDNLTKSAVHDIREELAGFYSVLKASEHFLNFVFITGVSKFNKTSIFSKLNNLSDISLDRQYADICGYTQHDLETIFADYLYDVDLETIKLWYNGYNFLGSNVYNPYDVLLFLKHKEYKAHWFETGTPAFLLELIKQRRFFVPDLEKIEITDSQMGEFDIDNIELDVLLFQTGYLTIKNVKKIGFEYIYELVIPNVEVRKGLNDYLMRMLYTPGIGSSERTGLYKKIYYAITNGTPADLEPAFTSFFAAIPADWYRKNNIGQYEGFYSAMFYACFAALGMDIVAEDITNKGKIDLTVKNKDAIYIFEFKMKYNPKNALQQIKQKKYHEKYMHLDKKIFLIGIEFDESVRNLSAFECDLLKE